MNRVRLFVAAGLMCLSLSTSAQRIQQPLGRGVVAVYNGSSVTVTWRRLAQEPEDATYNVYVNGIKKNTTPLANTNWKTTTGVVPIGAEVAVSIVVDDKESEPSTAFKMQRRDCRSMFMDINFEEGGSPLKSVNYNTAYVWPIDLNGNGEYDYVVNRKSNANSLDCYVEGYLSTGEHLWTVKLGPNELSCAGQDDMITVADMDCDGYGDVIIQSSDGTQFWDPEKKTYGLYVNGKTTGDTDGDGIIDYETQNTRNAPRYISIIDGRTGKEKASIEQSYNQHYNRTNRSALMGDEYNKHVGHMGVFFFDGLHPAVVMEWHMRGSGGDHHYYNLGVAYDFSSGKAGALKELFNAPTGGPAFHQIRVGDVDDDGCDEMIVGGYTMDHTGKTLFNTGISHGDRFRTSDIDPERPGLETFAIQQYAPDMLGQVLYDARTGEFIKKWYLPASGDVGRGECMDIDKNHLGWEMWSTMGKVYDAQGNLITGYDSQYPCEGIWWDEEPDRENVGTSDSHHNVYVQDFFKGRLIEIAKASGYRYVTVYAKRAAFWGDIIGDWREELVLLHKENGVIVGVSGFTTDIATSIDNIYCLQEDPHYRGDCSTRGYYQSPNPGFYLGYDMPRPQLPPCMVTDLVAQTDNQFLTYDRTAAASYADGKSLLFDLTYKSETFDISSAFAPSVIYAMPVRNQQITMQGTGSLEGDLAFWKSQKGRFVVNIPMNHTGGTIISEGVLEVNNTIQGNVDLRARGTLAGNATVAGKLNLEGALHYEGCRLMPGGQEGDLGTINLKQGLSIDQRLFVEVDIQDVTTAADLVRIEGDLTLGSKGQLVFTIVPDVAKLQPARYRLMEYTGEFSGNLALVSVRGLQGQSYTILNEEQAIWLVINEQRAPAQGVRWTGTESAVWDYQTANFEIEGQSTEFVAEDGVVVGDDATRATLQIDELMPVSNLTFENNTKTITLKGEGGITGESDLVMNGNGRLVLNTTKSDYTGKTIINSGTVTVSELADGGLPSSIGAASSAATNWQMGKATLIVNNSNTATNRGLTLNDTATIQINSGVASLKGQIRGDGRLVKKGSGQLNITYAGNNAWNSTELNGGVLAMGVWNTTIGKSGSLIEVTGNATINIFNNNSTSAVPSLGNAIMVAAGKTLTINGGQRCKVQGSLLGEGTVKINFPYVRGDFSTNLSKFQGILNPTSGQFRITTGLNFQLGTLMLGEGVYAVGVQSQSGSETSLTHKIGALSSTAKDAQLANGTWNVGYLGTNNTFAGIVATNATLNKYGEGTLTLSGTSTGKVQVYEGVVAGTGTVGNLSLLNGGGIKVVVRATNTVQALKVTGRVTLRNPVIYMERSSGSWSPDTDYQIFTTKVALTGTPQIEPAVPLEGYVWDYSALASDGILRIVSNPDGVGGVSAERSVATTYDLNGRPVAQPASRRGLLIRGGKKILVK